MYILTFLATFSYAAALWAGSTRQYASFCVTTYPNAVPHIARNLAGRSFLWITSTVGSIIGAMYIYKLLGIDGNYRILAAVAAIMVIFIRIFISSRRAYTLFLKTAVASEKQ